ncbi:MAG: hypothetical protein QOJ35_4145, partial [Solirubrobacteraceae bacterium]|nr:hypothetical protein [Solirubrobacteraceae bacterium]
MRNLPFAPAKGWRRRPVPPDGPPSVAPSRLTALDLGTVAAYRVPRGTR